MWSVITLGNFLSSLIIVVGHLRDTHLKSSAKDHCKTIVNEKNDCNISGFYKTQQSMCKDCICLIHRF